MFYPLRCQVFCELVFLVQVKGLYTVKPADATEFVQEKVWLARYPNPKGDISVWTRVRSPSPTTADEIIGRDDACCYIEMGSISEGKHMLRWYWRDQSEFDG